MLVAVAGLLLVSLVLVGQVAVVRQGLLVLLLLVQQTLAAVAAGCTKMQELEAQAVQAL